MKDRFGSLKYALNGVYSGGTPMAGDDSLYAESGSPFVTIGDMSSQTPILTAKRHLSEEGRRSKNLQTVETGTVLLSMYATIGLPNILGIDACISQAIIALNCRKDQHPSFLYWWLTHYRQMLEAEVAGSTQGNLNAERVKNIRFRFVDLATQRQIADFLDRETARIDLLIEKKQRLVALLREQYFANLECMTFPQDLPVDELVPFRWICRIAEGQVDPTSDTWRGRILIAPNHIESKTGRLLAMETAEEQGAISGKYAIGKGTVLYSKIRPALAKACISPSAGMCSADIYPIIPDKRLRPEYLLMQLLSSRFTDWATLESMRVAMPKINRETLGGFRLRVPPLGLQDEYVSTFAAKRSSLESVADKIKASIDRLKEYRSALITAAVTGQIDVQAYGKSGTVDRRLDAIQEEMEA